MLRSAIVVLMLFSLAGCATNYNKHSILESGGYEDVKIEDGAYVIRFQSNTFTSPSKTKDFAYLKAAEFAVEKGARYFRVEVERTYGPAVGGSWAALHITLHNEKPSMDVNLYDALETKNSLRAKYKL